MTQNSQDWSIEEYKTLRAEILQRINRELTLVNFSFTVTAAILGFAFSQEMSLPFLVPLLVLTLLLFQLNDSSRSVARIAAYIRTCLEKDLGLNYETKMYELREELKERPSADEGLRTARSVIARSPIFATVSSEIAAIVLGALCILLAFVYSFSSYERVICVVALVLWVIVSTATYLQSRYVGSGDYADELTDLWLRPNDNQASK